MEDKIRVELTLEITKNPETEDALYLWSKLREHGLSKLNDPDLEERFSFHITLKNNDLIVGGVIGMVYYRGMHVQLLWVDEGHRFQGLGSKLLVEAEKLAREHGCTVMYLDTFGFQAPDFYPKHGFEVFGVLEKFPKHYNRTFFKKELATDVG